MSGVSKPAARPRKRQRESRDTSASFIRLTVPRLKTCSTYTAKARSHCDGSGIEMSNLTNIVREQERLAAERRHAEKEFQALAGRMIRIRKQEEFLRKRGLEMLKRGLSSIEELEEQERVEADQKRLSKERQQAEESLRQPEFEQPLPTAEDVPSFDFSLLSHAPEFQALLVDPDSVGKTQQAHPSSSSGA
ncbi:hypothetical protein F4814DRAFT_421463 [Daldinia grandis]|nr:hypothetical protein F4814DRAFT_421463 [Daldinia grandis]